MTKLAQTKLTPTQLAQREERAARMAKDTPDSQTSSIDPAIEPTPRSLWLDQGETIPLGAKTYHVAEFALHKLDEGYEKVYAAPGIFLAVALAAQDQDHIDIALITEAYNSVMQRSIDDPDKPPYSEDYVSIMLTSMPEILRDKLIVDRMVDVVCFALKRKHPDITPEEIYTNDEFDRSWYIKFLQVLFRVNHGMRDAF
jgi:hypothetical protein